MNRSRWLLQGRMTSLNLDKYLMHCAPAWRKMHPLKSELLPFA